MNVLLILCMALLGPVIVLPEYMSGQNWHLGLWQGLVPLSVLLFCGLLCVSSYLRLGGCLHASMALETEVFSLRMDWKFFKICVSGFSCGL